MLDENVPHAIRDGLKRRLPEVEISVIGSEDAPTIGTKDKEILEFLESEMYILVSSNRTEIQ